MDRIVRPVARQLLRPRPRYPFAIPSAPAAKRLYTMGPNRPEVRYLLVGGVRDVECWL
jgi:succinate-semialdehyde dehydrogenase/glutarate-semialdehyde dehydrogenase